MELSCSILIAGPAIGLAVFSPGLMLARAIRGFAQVLYGALSIPARFVPDYTELEEQDPDEIRSHLPPWDHPSAFEVIAWQFSGIKEALFGLRDRIGGSPSAEEGR